MAGKKKKQVSKQDTRMLIEDALASPSKNLLPELDELKGSYAVEYMLEAMSAVGVEPYEALRLIRLARDYEGGS